MAFQKIDELNMLTFAGSEVLHLFCPEKLADVA